MAEIGAIASDNNLTLNGSDAATGINRGSFFGGKNEADGATTVDMSFDDVMDMINPLQHIPIASATYRAITGEKINPISRIAGDVLYGAALGPVSAGLTALGAIGDEALTAMGGESATGTVIAALFGNDAPEPTTQLASTPTTIPADMQVASLQTPAKQSPILDMPHLTDPTPEQVANAALPQPPIPQPTAPQDTTTVAAAQGIQLDRSKPAYGGAMDPTTVQSAQQNQQLALAMSNRNDILQAQRTIRSNRFAVAPHPTAPANAAPVAAAATTDVAPDATTQAAMQNLVKELQAMKGVNSYKNAAQMTPIPGTTVNLAN